MKPIALTATLACVSMFATLSASQAGCSSSSDNGSPSGDAGPDSSTPQDSSVGPDVGAQDTGALDTGTGQEASTEAGNEGGPGDGGVTGNVLISDQYNNRVIEVTRAGSIVWSFGDGKSVPGPTSIVAPNDAERLPGGRTLMSGTGTGPGTEKTCPADGGGCPDNRVLIIDDATGAIAWQYGADGGVAGKGPDKLNAPVAAIGLPNGNVVITDQGNARIIEVTMAKAIAWQYPAEDAGKSPLNNPNSAERLTSGNTLIADEGNDRVIEIDTHGVVVWQYPQKHDPKLLSGPAFASRLPTGNTLISDANNNRIVEITPTFTVAWTYVTNTRPGSNKNPIPTRAVRLTNGDTLISDQFNHQVIEVDHAGTVVYSYGQINKAGSGPGMLNGPYDAKVIGDFTGLTPPM